jgi:YjbE family integral membrane protein
VALVLTGVNQLGALLSVVIVDVVLAGDNAIVVGMAAAGLPVERRRRVIVLGIAVATILRILLAYFAVQLLAIIGMTLAGGVLLLWVSWKMYRDSRNADRRGGERSRERLAEITTNPAEESDALTQIVLADLSVSLDNASLAAGIARDHFSCWPSGSSSRSR